MKLITDGCLLIDVSAEKISQLAGAIKSVFTELGIECRPIAQSHHISVGYIVGNFSIEHLKDVAKEIAEKPFHLTFSGIEILRGVTTNQDFIALKVAENSDLDYAVGLLAENAPIRTFKEGFKTHLSLLTIEKDSISEADLVARYVELKVLGLISDIKLAVDRISIFSNDRKKIAQIPFSTAI